MTMRYSHLSRDFAQEAIENLGQKLQQFSTNMAQKGVDRKGHLHNLLLDKDATLAQLVEQRTENPCVRSSILRGGRLQ